MFSKVREGRGPDGLLARCMEINKAVGDPRYRVRVIDEALIGEVGRRLSAAAPGARVILFGSYAKGSVGPHSDLDLLVVEPSVQSPDDESVRLRRELRDVLVPMDIVVVSEDYVEQWRDVRGSLVNAALRDGRVLAA